MLSLLRWTFKVLFYALGISMLIGLFMGLLAARKWFMSNKDIVIMEQQYKIDTTGKSNTWNYGTPKQHKKHRTR